MTAPTIRQHIVSKVLPRDLLNYEVRNTVADALFADPTIAAIIDLAAEHRDDETFLYGPVVPDGVRSLLESWRASRAEQKPER